MAVGLLHGVIAMVIVPHPHLIGTIDASTTLFTRVRPTETWRERPTARASGIDHIVSAPISAKDIYQTRYSTTEYAHMYVWCDRELYRFRHVI